MCLKAGPDVQYSTRQSSSSLPFFLPVFKFIISPVPISSSLATDFEWFASSDESTLNVVDVPFYCLDQLESMSIFKRPNVESFQADVLSWIISIDMKVRKF